MKVLFRLRSSLLVLGVDLENRRTSGENEVLPENLGADVRSTDIWFEVSQWMHGPERGHTVQSVTGDFIFTNRHIALCIPYSRVVLVEIGLIEGFP
jgi:hypothetical protein